MELTSKRYYTQTWCSWTNPSPINRNNEKPFSWGLTFGGSLQVEGLWKLADSLHHSVGNSRLGTTAGKKARAVSWSPSELPYDVDENALTPPRENLTNHQLYLIQMSLIPSFAICYQRFYWKTNLQLFLCIFNESINKIASWTDINLPFISIIITRLVQSQSWKKKLTKQYMKVRARGRWNISLDEFFGFEKLLQVSHLPGTHNQKDGSLR